MRFINSLRNSALAFVGQIITILLGFVVRWLFIHNLGQDYLGVNSVMESMITILSMTELGIGASIAFALFQPIDDGDEKRIASIMNFYRNTYYIIGVITAVMGPLLLPFMRFFTKEAVDVNGLNIIYILFLLNTVLSYFFAYKRTLINAYQESYINSVTEDLFALVKYVLQAFVLVYFKSYISYLVISIVCALLTNIVISYNCDKKHPFIKKYKNEKLSAEDKKLIKTSVVSLIYQKIGAKIVTGTDNLLISYAKLTLMGIYSNYAMVVSIVSRVVYNVLRSVMGSMGSLMVQKNKYHKNNVFNEFSFANFCFYFLFAIGFSGCLERFILLWAGKDWLLSPLVTFVVILNFFLMGMRQPYIVVIEVAGLFNKLRLKAVGEVVVNLVVSFLFLIVFDMGIYGVLFGTTVSMVSICIWWEILVVYKEAIKLSPKHNIFQFVGYLIVAAVGCFAAYYVSGMIKFEGILGLFISGVCSVLIYGIIILVVYSRTAEFKNLLNRFLKKRGAKT